QRAEREEQLDSHRVRGVGSGTGTIGFILQARKRPTRAKPKTFSSVLPASHRPEEPPWFQSGRSATSVAKRPRLATKATRQGRVRTRGAASQRNQPASSASAKQARYCKRKPELA